MERVEPSMDLLHSLMAVYHKPKDSFAPGAAAQDGETSEEVDAAEARALADCNVAGFVVVQVRVLAPGPAPPMLLSFLSLIPVSDPHLDLPLV